MNFFQPRTIYFEKKNHILFDGKTIKGISFRIVSHELDISRNFSLIIAVSQQEENDHELTGKYLRSLQNHLLANLSLELSYLEEKSMLQGSFLGHHHLATLSMSEASEVEQNLCLWLATHLEHFSSILTRI